MLGLEGRCADGVAFTLASAYFATLVGYGFAGKFALRAFACAIPNRNPNPNPNPNPNLNPNLNPNPH